jgi:hypothetical protein
LVRKTITGCFNYHVSDRLGWVGSCIIEGLVRGAQLAKAADFLRRARVAARRGCISVMMLHIILICLYWGVGDDAVKAYQQLPGHLFAAA